MPHRRPSPSRATSAPSLLCDLDLATSVAFSSSVCYPSTCNPSSELQVTPPRCFLPLCGPPFASPFPKQLSLALPSSVRPLPRVTPPRCSPPPRAGCRVTSSSSLPPHVSSRDHAFLSDGGSSGDISLSSTRYTGFGGPVPHRLAEDIAFAVVRFMQKGGSFVNYYMYHGGTNFGCTAGGPFIATTYDYDAPIDGIMLLVIGTRCFRD